MTRFVPADINQLRDAVGEALMAEEPMEVLAGGSKRGLGRPMQTAHALDLSALSGIRDLSAVMHDLLRAPRGRLRRFARLHAHVRSPEFS